MLATCAVWFATRTPERAPETLAERVQQACKPDRVVDWAVRSGFWDLRPTHRIYVTCTDGRDAVRQVVIEREAK